MIYVIIEVWPYDSTPVVCAYRDEEEAHKFARSYAEQHGLGYQSGEGFESYVEVQAVELR